VHTAQAPPLAAPLRLPRHVVDFAGHELRSLDGLPVRLRPQALEVLLQLARRPGELVTREELLLRVWPGVVVTDDSLVQAVSDLRRALGDEGPQLVRTVPRRGYRLVVPETGPEPAAAAQPRPVAVQGAAAEQQAGSAGPAGRHQNRLVLPAVAATLGLLLLLLAIGLVWRLAASGPPAAPHPAAAVPDRPAIAVLDFRDGDEPTAAAPTRSEALARGFAEDLANQLARNADLRVIAAYSSFAAAAVGAPVPKIAEQLGARYLVNGSLRRRDQSLHLVVQLLDGRDGRIVWASPHELAAEDVYLTRDAIVRRIAGTVHSSMRTHQEAQAVQRPPSSLDIYDMTLRAIALKHRLTPESSREARALLERVVSLDPHYAPGWLYLGFVNSLDNQNLLNGPFSASRMHEAVAQINRSIALDSTLPAAHLALSLAYLPLGRHADALASAKRCLELGPSDAECLMHYASLLVRVAGRADQALPIAQEAIAANPLPPSYVMHQYGLVLWAQGELDQALHWLDSAVRRAPGNLHARLTHLTALVEAGRLEEARASLLSLNASGTLHLSAEAAAALTYAPDAQPLIDRRLAAFRRIGWPDPMVPTR
jgi:TolB-like protein/DNA-binding winged helix-turn-helix (wHTH) protein/Tfp pilus assembly protein PilF